MAQRQPVLIDTDIGDAPDDALAVILALKSPELEVRGITTVIDDVDAKTRFAWKLLGLYNGRDIPLTTGASEPLLSPKSSSHSRQYELLTPADTVPDSARRNAILFLIDTLQHSPNRMTVIALGPLTNLALAIKTEPSIKAKIERIVIMGGCYLMAEPEYNVQRDPAAAAIVFGSGIPITAVGLDVTRHLQLRDSDLERLRLADDPPGRFLARIVELAHAEQGGVNPTLYDPLALAAAFRPELIQTRTGTVTLDGAITRFQEGNGSTQIAVQANSQVFLDLFLNRIAQSLR